MTRAVCGPPRQWIFMGLREIVRCTRLRFRQATTRVKHCPQVRPGRRAATRLEEWGAMPYPMPYERTPDLVGFQRWVLTHYDKKVCWRDWEAAGYQPYKLKWESKSEGLFAVA